MPHRPLVNLINWHRADRAGIHRILQFTSVNFDVSAEEIFVALSYGHTLLVVSEELRRDPALLLDCLQKQSIDEVFAPQVLLEQLAAEADRRAVLLPIQHFHQAGEPLHVTPAVRRALDTAKTVLCNEYGPTETHVVSAFTVCEQTLAQTSSIPIGRPIANSRLYVLDAHLAPVPIGVSGELFIAGDCLARGYLGRRDLTAEKFIPSPFESGQRLYRTGDQARYRSDGALDFIGRIDQQIKLRGYRIELGEIELLLMEHPRIADACVVLREDPPGQKHLVAYVVAKDAADAQWGGEIEPGDLREFLARQLPEYMLPSMYVELAALPRTPNGKVDRNALPAAEAGSWAANTYTAPRTPIEERLAQIWAEVLGLPSIGIHDNFFDIGGHSLLATRVTSRIRQALAVKLPVRALFEASTIARLASRIEGEVETLGLQSDLRRTALLPLVPVKRTGAMPLSYSQQRLWFLERLEGVSATYNVPIAFRV
jgi:acyl carrier protein